MNVYHSSQPFLLESGESLPQLDIAYHTYGTLSDKKDNVVWVCHALTANSDVADWLPHTVEKGGFLDPEKYFVVCANILGSCYGSTGPLSINPVTGEPYYTDFPHLTMRDLVKAHILLADALGLESIHSLVGCSVGGFQAIEWAVMEPGRFDKLILMATAPIATPWTIALDETQRMAIKCDPTYGQRNPEGGKTGLATARAIGLLSYRGPSGYNATQRDPYTDEIPTTHRACTYQRHQGEKLCRRFDAYSYMSILDTFDTHDVGRRRGGVENAVKSIKAKTIVIGITTDIVFPPEDMRKLTAMIPDAEYYELESEFGHDGFLVEHEKLNAILTKH